MKKRWRVTGCISLVVLFFLGFGLRVRRCASCDVQGPGDATWYGIRLYSYPHPEWLFDEFRTLELWEQLYGPCDHKWHFMTAVLLVVPIDHGAPLHIRFDRGRGPAGLWLLAREDKEWARRTWEALGNLPLEAQGAPLASLEEFGVPGLGEMYAGKKVPRDYIVEWWNKNQDWIASPAPPDSKPK